MALYEYLCAHCGNRFEKRMPMSEVVQLLACTRCGKQAQKTLGAFAFVGRAEAGFGDGPAPWDDGDGDDDYGHSHGHSHGEGSHGHGFDDDLDF